MSSKPNKHFVILISGAGSNMAAIVRAAQAQDWQGAFGARVAAVISNRPAAAGLQLAQSLGVAASVLDHQSFA